MTAAHRVMVTGDGGAVAGHVMGQLPPEAVVDGRLLDTEEALAAAAEVDAVVLAVDACTRSTIETARALAQRGRVLLVAPSADHATLVGMIRTGVSGCLVHREADRAELLRAIAEVARGLSYVSASATPALFDVVRGETPPAPPEAGREPLTAREAEIMSMIARGMSNPAIAATLVVSQKTVKNHINNAYTKLGVANRREAIVAWHAVPIAS